ncbi:MAG: TonB family protein [Saprospiraceae bacterium]|nr:TonB family protein [Saprospiraceae bacterium]
MNVAFTSNMTFFLLGGIFVLTIGIIYFFRYRMSHFNRDELKARFGHRQGRNLLSGRNKFPEVDTFRYSQTFLQYGLLATLFVVVAALNWTTFERQVLIPDNALDLTEDITLEVPRSAEPPPPPPPPPPPMIQEVPEEFIEDLDQPEFVDQSIERETEVRAPEPVKTEAPPPPPPPPPPPKEEEIFVIAEDMPRFPGCENLGSKKEKEECAKGQLLEFIYKNIQYPAIARENGVEGTVVISFVVEKDGQVKETRIVREIGAGCGDEALRVVELMNTEGKRWTPGKQRGKPVRVMFNLPVKFKLK